MKNPNPLEKSKELKCKIPNKKSREFFIKLIIEQSENISFWNQVLEFSNTDHRISSKPRRDFNSIHKEACKLVSKGKTISESLKILSFCSTYYYKKASTQQKLEIRQIKSSFRGK